MAVFAIFMATAMMTTFTVGALGMAAAIGLGAGAVFKLVPEQLPDPGRDELVGAAGGWAGSSRPWCSGPSAKPPGRSPGVRAPGH